MVECAIHEHGPLVARVVAQSAGRNSVRGDTTGVINTVVNDVKSLVLGTLATDLATAFGASKAAATVRLAVGHRHGALDALVANNALKKKGKKKRKKQRKKLSNRRIVDFLVCRHAVWMVRTASIVDVALREGLMASQTHVATGMKLLPERYDLIAVRNALAAFRTLAALSRTPHQNCFID